MNEQAEVVEATPLVPQWTLADFMSDAPYEYLYSKRDNKYLLQKMLNIAQQMAKAVKFAGFMKTWNAYVQANAPQTTVMGAYQTQFSDQPTQLAAGKYVCDDNGVRQFLLGGENIPEISEAHFRRDIMLVAQIIPASLLHVGYADDFHSLRELLGIAGIDGSPAAASDDNHRDGMVRFGYEVADGFEPGQRFGFGFVVGC